VVAGAAVQPAAVRLGDADDPRDLAAEVAERLAEHVDGALGRVSRSISTSSASDTESDCSAVSSGPSAGSGVSTGSGSHGPGRPRGGRARR
jgi:hypothetical protein